MRKIKILLCVFIALIFLLFSCFIFLYLRFPKKFYNEILKYSTEYNLEKELVQSIIKVESGYDKNAKSSQGALGLMQIIPSTAYEISDKLSINNFNENMLFLPEINIHFGCFYVRYLIDYYDGNITNALCSYNAGLQNVNNWLKNSKYSKNGDDLSLIPFEETNNYLKKVKFAINVYKILYK